MSTRSNSAATERPAAVWIVLGLAVAIGATAVRLSGSSPSALPPPAAALPYPAGPSQVPQLRVLVVPPRTEPLRLRIAGPYRVTALGSWRVLAQGSDLPETLVTLAPRGLQIGPRRFEPDAVQIHVVRPGTLSVDAVAYYGDLNLLRHGVDRLAAVNLVDLERYVCDLLAAAQPDAGQPDDALAPAWEALAIAARTYALYRTKTVGADEDWDLRCDAEGFAYGGSGDPQADDAPTALRRQAAERTRAIVMTYQRRLFCPLATRCCGGHTVDATRLYQGAAPPLIGVPCPACLQAAEPGWQRTVPVAELHQRLAQHLQRLGRTVGTIQQVRTSEVPPSDLPEVLVQGTDGEARLTARAFRLQVAADQPLPGLRFSIRRQRDDYLLGGRSRGHGAGLCGYGAQCQAAEGSTATEILAHYFPGSELIAVR